MNEYLKSFRAAVGDRFSSPLFGNFILSWIVFNWKIIYVTLFIDADKLFDKELLAKGVAQPITKLDYIQRYLIEPHHSWEYPLYATAALILVVPFASAVAVIVPEIANKLKNNWRIKIRGSRYVLMEEHVTALKEAEKERSSYLEMKNQKESAEKMLSERGVELSKISTNLMQTESRLSNSNSELEKMRTENSGLHIQLAEEDIKADWYLDNSPTVVSTKTPLGMNSGFILSQTGSISIWVKIPPAETFYKKTMNHIYVFGHDTNKGNSISQNPKELKYKDVFALKLSPNFTNTNKRPPTKVWWSFWITNSLCQGIEVNSEEWTNDKEAWHHFVVRWNHVSNNLQLLIDNKLIHTHQSYLDNWPKRTSGNIAIGNWPNLLEVHNLGMPLARLATTEEYFTNSWIRKEFAKKNLLS
jgi:hypothetical protein